MTTQKGTIYLEPRKTWDRAIIDQENIIYSLSIILYILMESQSMEYIEALEYYCYNIEPLTFQGLSIQDDIGE